MNKKKEVGVGDIVIMDGKEHILLTYDIREDHASTAYDRTYWFCLLEDFLNKVAAHGGVLPENAFDSLCTTARKVVVKGASYPEFVFSETAPYEIRTATYYAVRQKEPRTVVTYE